jgi:dihydropteroate synthase
MGIVNVTPDSFSDGGRHNDVSAAVQHAYQLMAEGAGIVDVGGESTRPGARQISEQEELDRVIPVIESLRQESSMPISIDSSKPIVMREAVKAGANLINDVRALTVEGALATAVELDVPVCLMHMQGQPDSMQDSPHYLHVVYEVRNWLQTRAEECVRAGLSAGKICIDPGFGFGKTLDHNLLLLEYLDVLVASDFPVLVGLSRKSMFGQLLNQPDTDKRLMPSVMAAGIAVLKGAAIVRVHDVAETRQAISLCQALIEKRGNS